MPTPPTGDIVTHGHQCTTARRDTIEAAGLMSCNLIAFESFNSTDMIVQEWRASRNIHTKLF